MNSNNSADVTIDRIAAGGDGIARAGDLVVFVPRTVPGDRVRVRLEVKKRFARGVVDEILEAAPSRIDPLCYHYRVDRCGGCQLQQMNYPAQLEAKRGIIRDSLTRIGKRAVELPTIVESASQWRYRRKLTLAMRKGPDGEWIIGLHPFDDPVGVFQLADCPITDVSVLNVWRQIMEARRHFPPADELRASVRLIDEGTAIVMEGGETWPKRDAFFDAVPQATALWWKPDNRARTLIAERGRALASAAFAQVNAEMGEALHAHVLDLARAHRPRTVVDAYAGIGATAIALAKDGILVTAIESDKEASARCAAELPHGSRAIAARVEDVLEGTLPADVVLINPPRVGIDARAAAILERASPAPRALIYVSCDPATLARDIARMPRYQIVSLKAFDMFPQTAHVETVCELVPVEGQA